MKRVGNLGLGLGLVLLAACGPTGKLAYVDGTTPGVLADGELRDHPIVASDIAFFMVKYQSDRVWLTLSQLQGGDGTKFNLYLLTGEQVSSLDGALGDGDFQYAVEELGGTAEEKKYKANGTYTMGKDGDVYEIQLNVADATANLAGKIGSGDYKGEQTFTFRFKSAG